MKCISTFSRYFQIVLLFIGLTSAPVLAMYLIGILVPKAGWKVGGPSRLTSVHLECTHDHIFFYLSKADVFYFVFI